LALPNATLERITDHFRERRASSGKRLHCYWQKASCYQSII